MSQIITSIEDRAILAYLSVGGWSARKLDKKATAAVIKDAKATTSDAGRFNKNLLADADKALANIRKKGDDARKYLDANTLPWDDAGNRLLPNQKSIEVIGTITQMETEYHKAVDEFVRDYPVLRAQALAALGDLANPDDYPQPDVVRGKFYFRISLQPMAKGFAKGNDFRLGLNDQQLAALQQHYEGRANEQFRRALDVAWGRLRTTVEHLSDRLTPNADDPQKTKIFRDSMLENARETCELLRALNVFGDPSLESARQRVEAIVNSVDVDTLRTVPSVAASVKASVDEILRGMSPFGA